MSCAFSNVITLACMRRNLLSLMGAKGVPVLLETSTRLRPGRRSWPTAYADRNEGLATLAFVIRSRIVTFRHR